MPDCVCIPEEVDGYKYVQWIGSTFGDCIYTPLEKFSYYSGILSIVFYFIAFYPQIYENYRRKSTDGLSLVLIIIWFLGDFSNYIGTILTEQYPIQKVVGIYFALMEVIIIVQYVYYKFFYKGPSVVDEDEEHEPNEYDSLIVKTEGGDEPSSHSPNHISPQQSTYETFSDIQKTPIQPPSDPVEFGSSPNNVNESSTRNTNTNLVSSLSSSLISKSSSFGKTEEVLPIPRSPIKPKSNPQPKELEIVSEQEQQSEPIESRLEEPVKEEEKEIQSQPEPESKPESKPEPESESESETKYETLDEISQKQQQKQQQQQQQKEEVPVYEITSNINKDTKSDAYSASVNNSVSQVSMRTPKNESQESLDDEEDDENTKDSSEALYESSSKEASSLSLDTKDEDEDEDEEETNEGGISRSESSLNKKNKKKKGKKGKKKRGGRKPKKGKGLSTVIHTIAMLSLFIIQVQARAFIWPEGYSILDGRDQQNNGSDGQLPRCDQGPNLNIYQKILGSFMAWSSGLLYFCSRIPQILENKKNRSVEGLSILLFVCTILGNLFYGLSILTRFPPIDEKFFAGTLPYLIGSVGTFIFDIMIIYQFNAYKKPAQGYQHLE